MKPVAIFRHYPTEGPGYFATFLDERGIPWVLVKIDENAAVPTSATQFGGLVFMGGPMSVNDDLPWIAPLLALIREARDRDIPLLGHCLGGQLISKALGGVVGKNPVKEIGWGEVQATDSEIARAWLGEVGAFESFHWHGETFTLPPGATRIMSSRYCENQAWVFGKHLALQCHVEMTADMVQTWCAQGAKEIADNPGSSVQTAAAMQADLARRVKTLNRVAERIYQRWIKGVVG